MDKLSRKFKLEQTTGSVVISEVDGLTDVVLSEPKKKYMDLVGITEYITLQAVCCTDRGRYNRVQPYFYLAYKKTATAIRGPIFTNSTNCLAMCVCVCGVCVCVCVF